MSRRFPYNPIASEFTDSEREAIRELVLRKTVPITESGCWIWTGCVANTGYGDTGFRQRKRSRAHLISYQAFYGPIKDGLVVRHKCDVRLCCNPDHLTLGTQADNCADMYSRGRGTFQIGTANPAKREQHGMARLTESDIEAIRNERSSGRKYSQIARDRSVDKSHVRRICLGISWRESP